MTYLPPPPDDDQAFDIPRKLAFHDFLQAVAISTLSIAIALIFIVVIAVVQGNPALGAEPGDPREAYTTQPAQVIGLHASFGRPSDCPQRRWCGCWLEHYFGLSDPALWRALNWQGVGQPAAGPAPGVIAIYRRGRNGGHVGVITKVIGPGLIVLLSGNDGNAVRERERSTDGVISYRRL